MIECQPERTVIGGIVGKREQVIVDVDADFLPNESSSSFNSGPHVWEFFFYLASQLFVCEQNSIFAIQSYAVW